MNFLQLITGLRLICKKRNTRSQVIAAHRYFKKFIVEARVLYGNNIMTMKMHSLIHLVCSTLDFGPSSEYSCKRGEDLNGSIRENIFGTQNIIQQLIKRFLGYTTYKTMISTIENTLKQRIIDTNTAVGKFLLNIGAIQHDGTSSQWKHGEGIYKDMLYKTQCNIVNIPEDGGLRTKISKIITPSKLEEVTIREYHKIKIGTRSFNTFKKSTSRRDSSFVVYNHENQLFIGRIIAFLHVQELNLWLCCICKIDSHKCGQLIYEYSLTSEYHVIDVFNLKDQMIYSATQRLLTECSCNEFYVEPNDEDKLYPFNEENEELMEFIREKYMKQFGQVHELK